MLDPDLKTELDKINQNLTAIEKKKGPGIWRSFFNGMFGALGYVLGLALIIVLLAWALQKTGLLKPFQDQVKSFTDLMNSAKKLMPQDSQPGGQSTSTPGSGGQSVITLPSGQQYKVNMTQ